MHEKRDSKKAEAFKRDFLGILRRRPISGKMPIKIWFADESRYGLLPNCGLLKDCVLTNAGRASINGATAMVR